MYMHNFIRYLNYHDLYLWTANIPGAVFEFGVLNGEHKPGRTISYNVNVAVDNGHR